MQQEGGAPYRRRGSPPLSAAMSPAILPQPGPAISATCDGFRLRSFNKPCNLSTRDTQSMPDGRRRCLLHLSRCVGQSGRSLRPGDYCRQRGGMAVWPGWCAARLLRCDRLSRWCWSFRHGRWGWCRGRGGNRTTEPPDVNRRTTEPQTAPQHPPRVKCKCPSRHPTRIGLPSHDSHWLVCWSFGLLACCCRAINLDCRCRVASRASAVSLSSPVVWKASPRPGVLGWLGVEDGGWGRGMYRTCPRMGGGKSARSKRRGGSKGRRSAPLACKWCCPVPYLARSSEERDNRPSSVPGGGHWPVAQNVHCNWVPPTLLFIGTRNGTTWYTRRCHPPAGAPGSDCRSSVAAALSYAKLSPYPLASLSPPRSPHTSPRLRPCSGPDPSFHSFVPTHTSEAPLRTWENLD